MPNLWTQLLGRSPKPLKRSGADWLTFNGLHYPVVGAQSPTSSKEEVEHSFVGYVRQAYKDNGIVFAAMLARQMLFAQARFAWAERGSDDLSYVGGDLELLERPWPNGGTGELAARMIQDADLSGNFYAVREPKRLRRLRPDWVDIVLTAPPSEAVESDVAGYLYWPGGRASASAPRPFLPEQVMHWSPIPDPEAQYRGMSWLTPVIREIQGDKYATEHKNAFFTNGATLQTIIRLSENIKAADFKVFLDLMNESHQGVQNAYKNLVVGGGADVSVVGADLKQLDFKATQGAGETRIAAASGMHPVILGLSEGLSGSSLNAGNFNSARRLTADKTLYPLWDSAAQSLGQLVKPPPGKRLAIDAKRIPFLREDVKDAAEIQALDAQATRTYTDAGFNPDKVIEAVAARNPKLLIGQHTGLYSVQLQPPTTGQQPGQPSEGDTGEDQ